MKPTLLVITAVGVLALASAQAQTNTPAYKSKEIEAPAVVVDKVVASPKKFKGTINVSGQVGKAPPTNGLFVLTCEDACVSMPVKFSGAAPQPGTDVVVRGQVTKDAKGRYLFQADAVTAKQ